MAELADNNSFNKSMDKSPFEIILDLSSHQSIDLLSLPTDYRSSDYVQAVAELIHNLHVEIRRKFILSNDTYKLVAHAHRRHREFNKGDYVKILICHERYLKHAAKKLYARTKRPYPFFVGLDPILF